MMREPPYSLTTRSTAFTGPQAIRFTLTAWTFTVLFGHLTAALLAAILFPLLYELATNWSGLKNLTSYLAMRADNIPAFPALTKKLEPEKKLTPIFLFVSL